MNKRQLGKEKTRQKIVAVTRELIIQDGIHRLTAKDIAQGCEIAHGSMFLHFNSMDNLLHQVIYDELIRMGQSLYEAADGLEDVDVLMEVYLDMVEKEEAFLSRLYQEFEFLSDALKSHILSLECIHRNFFYKVIEAGIKQGVYKQVDITLVLTGFFSTIHYYLVRRQYYAKVSVIKENRNHIKDILMMMIQK